MNDCCKNVTYVLFCCNILVYCVFAQLGLLKPLICHPESFCPPKPATRRVFFFVCPLELPQPHAGISLYSPPLVWVQTQSSPSLREEGKKAPLPQHIILSAP